MSYRRNLNRDPNNRERSILDEYTESMPYELTPLETKPISYSSIRTDQNNLYYSISITNPNLVSNTHVFATFTETRSTPIIKNPSNYRLSVTRFIIPSSSIPIQLIPIQYNSTTPTDPNLTLYSITLSAGGHTVQQYIEWITEDVEATIPPPPTPTSPAINTNYQQYYSLYNYQHFCDIVNTAFSTAFTTLKGLITLSSAMPPILTYDGKTQLFTFYVEETYISDGINLYMNSLMAGLFFGSLNLITLGHDTVTGKDCQLVIQNTYNNVWPAGTLNFDLANGYYSFQQQFVNVNTPVWQSLSQIVITSDLPTASQLVPNLTSTGVQQQSQSNFKPILTDFNIVGDRTAIVYNPSAQYRYIDLQGSSPINTINLQIYWTDTLGNFYPLYIYPTEQINILILFERLNNKELV